VQTVADWLSSEKSGSWLMVLDNADDAELWLGNQHSEGGMGKRAVPLFDYLPRGSHGRVLITTRDSQLGKQLAATKKRPIVGQSIIASTRIRWNRKIGGRDQGSWMLPTVHTMRLFRCKYKNTACDLVQLRTGCKDRSLVSRRRMRRCKIGEVGFKQRMGAQIIRWLDFSNE
jgi:hypothetical protein